jgi:hypothetical protein
MKQIKNLPMAQETLSMFLGPFFRVPRRLSLCLFTVVFLGPMLVGVRLGLAPLLVP